MFGGVVNMIVRARSDDQRGSNGRVTPALTRATGAKADT
jgi:hypothetical protein